VGVFLFPQLSFCQNFYDREFSSSGNKVKERKVISWPYLKESDVFIVKYVERIVDVREKQNQPMAYPANPLATILYNAVLTGKMVPYQSDSMNRVISLSKFISIGNDTEVLSIPVDPDDPSYTIDTSIVNPFVPVDRIKKFRIVELWLFDKTRSQYSVRIVSIAPQFELKMGGVNLGWQDLCVLKYYSKDQMDIRHVCVNHDVFNRQNNTVELSFDDWFEQRLFSSYITKVSNMHDLPIRAQSEFKDNGVESLLEGERKQKELIEREENLYED
jgi:gliding motility associated protien GldN